MSKSAVNIFLLSCWVGWPFLFSGHTHHSQCPLAEAQWVTQPIWLRPQSTWQLMEAQACICFAQWHTRTVWNQQPSLFREAAAKSRLPCLTTTNQVTPGDRRLVVQFILWPTSCWWINAPLHLYTSTTQINELDLGQYWFNISAVILEARLCNNTS